MADIEFYLKLKDGITAQLAGMDAALKNVDVGARKLEGAMSSAATAGGALRTQIMAAASAFAVGFSAKSIIDLGSNFEDTALSIAGSIRAMGLTQSLEDAQVLGGQALDTLRAKAAKLPGETQEYIEVFKQGLPKAIESGMGDLTKIAEFTSQFTAVALSNQVDAVQAGGDLMRMLGGVAGQEVAMFRVLSPFIGKTTEDFNKMSIAARRLAIMEAIGHFTEQTAKAQDTYSAKMGEFKSRIEEVIRLGSVPVFEGMKTSLDAINAALEKNGPQIQAFVQAVSIDLVNGFSWLMQNGPTIANYIKNIAELWLSFKAGLAVAEIVKGIMEIVSAYKALKNATLMTAVAQALAMPTKALIGGGVAAAAMFGAFKLMESKLEDSISGKVTPTPTPMPVTTLPPTLPSAKTETPKGRTPAPIYDFRGSRFDIKQDFAEGFDPDRIAVAFASDLARLGEMKIQSAFAPIGAMR